MITIYRQSWDANAEKFGTLCSESAMIQLAIMGLPVQLIEGWCPNENCGCELETEGEHAAIQQINEGAPNLDAMSRTELFDTYTTLHDVARKTRNNGLRGIMLELAHYAEQKREAMRLRLDSQIANAMVVETRCDRIYDHLPAWLQW